MVTVAGPGRRAKRGAWSPSDADRAAAAALGADAAFVPIPWDPRSPAREDRELGGGYGAVRAEVALPWPTLGLALAVWEAFPGQAHRVLRQRIRRTSPVTALDRAVADVAAKRVAYVAAGAEVDAGVPVHNLGDAARSGWQRAIDAGGAWVGPGRVRGDAELAQVVTDAVPTPAEAPRVHRDRPVAALLVAPRPGGEGEVQWVGTNAGGANRVIHAELALVASWWSTRGRLPAGWWVATSLQPCRMCAEVLIAAAEGPIDVRYVEGDPGRLATRTALQARGWERQLRCG